MPVLQALLAAATFGLSAPLAKRMLDAASPLFLAGLLYLGAGVFLGEPLTGRLALTAVLMAVGAWLLLRERHSHRHHHEAGTHTHRHVHDRHHRHEHQGWEGPEPHVHPHPT